MLKAKLKEFFKKFIAGSDVYSAIYLARIKSMARSFDDIDLCKT